MTRACFFFFSASRKSSEPRWLTLEGLSSQDCSGGGGAWGLQTRYSEEQNLLYLLQGGKHCSTFILSGKINFFFNYFFIN